MAAISVMVVVAVVYVQNCCAGELAPSLVDNDRGGFPLIANFPPGISRKLVGAYSCIYFVLARYWSFLVFDWQQACVRFLFGPESVLGPNFFFNLY